LRRDLEIATALSFQKAGYSRDESRRMAARHMDGEPVMLNHNGGPSLDSD